MKKAPELDIAKHPETPPNGHLLEEGDACPVANCTGYLEFEEADNCSCHLSPPCSACLETSLFCPECGFVAED